MYVCMQACMHIYKNWPIIETKTSTSISNIQYYINVFAQNFPSVFACLLHMCRTQEYKQHAFSHNRRLFEITFFFLILFIFVHLKPASKPCVHTYACTHTHSPFIFGRSSTSSSSLLYTQTRICQKLLCKCKL